MKTRPPKYDAKQIDDIYKRYKEYMNTQYFERPELIKSGERAGEQVDVKVKKPLTIVSFCLFADIAPKCFHEIVNGDTLSDPDYKDIRDIYTRIRDDIQDSQISGATVNVYNASIVARLNGLADRQEITELNKPEQVVINIQGSNFDLTK